jgi:multidrug efflux pump subunit AcrB
LNIPINVGSTTYRISNFVDNRIENAIASVKRENGNIQITVDSDLEKGIDTLTTQKAIETFAQSYNFPAGISYGTG